MTSHFFHQQLTCLLPPDFDSSFEDELTKKVEEVEQQMETLDNKSSNTRDSQQQGDPSPSLSQDSQQTNETNKTTPTTQDQKDSEGNSHLSPSNSSKSSVTANTYVEPPFIQVNTGVQFLPAREQTFRFLIKLKAIEPWGPKKQAEILTAIRTVMKLIDKLSLKKCGAGVKKSLLYPWFFLNNKKGHEGVDYKFRTNYYDIREIYSGTTNSHQGTQPIWLRLNLGFSSKVSPSDIVRYANKHSKDLLNNKFEMFDHLLQVENSVDAGWLLAYPTDIKFDVETFRSELSARVGIPLMVKTQYIRAHCEKSGPNRTNTQLDEKDLVRAIHVECPQDAEFQVKAKLTKVFPKQRQVTYRYPYGCRAIFVPNGKSEEADAATKELREAQKELHQQMFITGPLSEIVDLKAPLVTALPHLTLRSIICDFKGVANPYLFLGAEQHRNEAHFKLYFWKEDAERVNIVIPHMYSIIKQSIDLFKLTPPQKVEFLKNLRKCFSSTHVAVCEAQPFDLDSVDHIVSDSNYLRSLATDLLQYDPHNDDDAEDIVEVDDTASTWSQITILKRLKSKATSQPNTSSKSNDTRDSPDDITVDTTTVVQTREMDEVSVVTEGAQEGESLVTIDSKKSVKGKLSHLVKENQELKAQVSAQESAMKTQESAMKTQQKEMLELQTMMANLIRRVTPPSHSDDEQSPPNTPDRSTTTTAPMSTPDSYTSESDVPMEEPSDLSDHSDSAPDDEEVSITSKPDSDRKTKPTTISTKSSMSHETPTRKGQLAEKVQQTIPFDRTASSTGKASASQSRKSQKSHGLGRGGGLP